MKVLGISGLEKSVSFKKKHYPRLSNRAYRMAQGFDSAAALIDDTGVVAAVAEERLSREKGTGAFPVQAIHYCLKTAGISLEEVDFIAHGFAYDSYKEDFESHPFLANQYEEVYAESVQKQTMREYFSHPNA